MSANLENSAVATGLEKVSFNSNPKERQCQRMLKLLHNFTHLTHYKVMLKILQARLQHYMNSELSDIQAGFRKGRGSRDQIANIRWSWKKQESSRKNIYFGFFDYAKAFDCVRGWESQGTGWREEKKAKNYTFILSFLSLSSSLSFFLSFQSFLKRQEAVLRHGLKILNLHNLYKSM